MQNLLGHVIPALSASDLLWRLVDKVRGHIVIVTAILFWKDGILYLCNFGSPCGRSYELFFVVVIIVNRVNDHFGESA